MRQFVLNLPPDTIRSAPGDYLLCRQPDQSWRLYQVEDLVLVKRLIPVADPPGALMLEEQLLDSLAPAYFNEVYLLLTAFAPVFATEQDALQALDRQEPAAQSRGLLRAAREFPQTSCRVIRRATPH